MRNFHPFRLDFFNNQERVLNSKDITDDTDYVLTYVNNNYTKEISIGDIFYLNNHFYVFSFKRDGLKSNYSKGIIGAGFKIYQDSYREVSECSIFELDLLKAKYIGNCITQKNIDEIAFAIYMDITNGEGNILSSDKKSLKISLKEMTNDKRNLFHLSNNIILVDSSKENSIFTFPRNVEYDTNEKMKEFFERQKELDFTAFQIPVEFNFMYEKDTDYEDIFDSEKINHKGFIFTSTILDLKEDAQKALDLFIKKNDIKGNYKNKMFLDKLNAYAVLDIRFDLKFIYQSGAFTNFIVNPNNKMFEKLVYVNENEKYMRKYLSII